MVWLDIALLKYLSIPIVAGLVGWSTNWVAIELTFRPLKFVGLKRFRIGWQGIIPAKAEKMASTFVDSTMARLGELPELLEVIGPERLARQITRTVLPEIDGYTDRVASEHHLAVWSRTPEVVKEIVRGRVRKELPRRVDALVAELSERFLELIDFKHMIVSLLTGDLRLLNRLFLESGAREFRFIVRSGLTFGGLFGIAQLGVWLIAPSWWVLPAFGFLVGWATNWIALNVIFRPLEAVKIGPWVLQGLFLRRQKEVAAVWCRIVTRELITVSHIADNLLHGPNAEQVEEMIRRHIGAIVGEAMGRIGPVASAVLGPAGVEQLEDSAAGIALSIADRPFADPEFDEQRAVAIEAFLRGRMEQMSPATFQDLLRPCFQEDEWMLILMGALLGLGAGVAQLFFVFGGG